MYLSMYEQSYLFFFHINFRLNFDNHERLSFHLAAFSSLLLSFSLLSSAFSGCTKSLSISDHQETTDLSEQQPKKFLVA